MGRELTSHKVTGLNEALKIEVLDEPIVGLASVRGDYIPPDEEPKIFQAWNAARETVEELDLDQPATLEWVKNREGWTGDVFATWCGGQIACYITGGALYLQVCQKMHREPTRRQIIAAEVFAKEMGWV